MTAELRAEYEQTGTLQEVQRLKDAIEDCERERQRAVTAFQKGYVQEDELDVRMRSINERREMYQMELHRLQRIIADYEQHMAALADFKAMANELADSVRGAPQGTRDRLMATLIARVIIERDRIIVLLHRARGSVTDATAARRCK